jgi:hypothetical protein
MNLRELYQEKLARLQAGPAPVKRDPGPPSATSESPAESWLAERSAARANPDDLCAGELANILEGLTPSGKDKRGRQVSFVEKGTDFYGNRGTVTRIGSSSKRISGG